MVYERVLSALADPTRRTILELLQERPRSVGDIARQLPVSQPAVSQHLRVLREAGLVDHTQDGARRIYRPCPEGLDDLRAYVDTLWDGVLEAFARSEAGGNGKRGKE